MTNKQRGVMFLAFGLFLPTVFLVGGGVLGSTNGLYWTMVFGAGYMAGLLVVGPYVFHSAMTISHNQSQPLPKWFFVFWPIKFVIIFVLTSMFMRSEWFSGNIGRYVFLLAMGFCLELFVPLGLGMMMAPERPASSGPAAS